MIRGTTAPFRFEVPYPKDQIDKVIVKAWQDGNVGTPTARLPIYKNFSSQSDTNTCELVAETDNLTMVCVVLTASESMRFSDKKRAQIQLSAQLTNLDKFASHVHEFKVYPLPDDLIIDDPEDLPTTEDGWSILDGGQIGGDE